eukprot:UN00421
MFLRRQGIQMEFGGYGKLRCDEKFGRITDHEFTFSRTLHILKGYSIIDFADCILCSLLSIKFDSQNFWRVKILNFQTGR